MDLEISQRSGAYLFIHWHNIHIDINYNPAYLTDFISILERMLIVACHRISLFGHTGPGGAAEGKGVLCWKVVEQKVLGRATEDTDVDPIIRVRRGLEEVSKREQWRK
jgi:hypothetical protein